MGKKFRDLSKEDRRELALDIAQTISYYSTNGVRMSKLLDEIMKLHPDVEKDAIERIIRVELPKSLGKITVGERRWSVYVVDDLEVACQLINDYYDKGMNKINLWNLRKEVCEYISKNPGVTTKELESEFSLNENFIDEMNSELVEYNVGIDFYKSTNNGVKMRINNENTLSAIDGILADLSSKMKESQKHSISSKSSENKKMKEIDEATRMRIQMRILRILYSKKDGRFNRSEISKIYYKKYGELVNDLTIKSMIEKMDGIGTNKDESYWIKDLSEALSSIDKKSDYIRIEVASSIKLDESKYPGLRFSREFNGINLYIFENENNHSSINSLFNIIIDGGSIDPVIKDKILDMVKDSFINGERRLL